MAAHYSILAWEIPWTEEPGGQATVRGVTKSWTQLSTGMHTDNIYLTKFHTERG